jgi:hypothetical protein
MFWSLLGWDAQAPVYAIRAVPDEQDHRLLEENRLELPGRSFCTQAGTKWTELSLS